jgi:putative signal transducing protein
MDFDNDNLVLAYTGSEISSNILKEYLEESDIKSIIRNKKNTSLSAGFGTASRCEVYLFDHDMERAKPLLEEFSKTDEG